MNKMDKNELIYFDECDLSEDDRKRLLDSLENFKPNLNFKSDIKIYHNGKILTKLDLMKSL